MRGFLDARAAARGGAPQVVVPQMFDQHYFAARVDSLGIGVAHAPGTPTRDSLTSALRKALGPGVTEKARGFARRIRGDGAFVAAKALEERQWARRPS